MYIFLAEFISSTHGGTLNIEVSTQIAEVSPKFVGVNLDWWLPQCGGEGTVWGNASALLLDLQNSRLRTLARGLSGGSLRVGGTHEVCHTSINCTRNRRICTALLSDIAEIYTIYTMCDVL